MKVLIIEDEAINIEIISDHLIRYNNKIEIVTSLKSKEAIEKWYKTNKQVDLVFSDIELLDGNVFSLLKTNIIKSPIIFTTAYNTFYQEAFDVNGIAYLLKPISYNKFCKAMDKYESLQNKEVNWKKLSETIHGLQNNYKERVIIKSKTEIKILSTKNTGVILSNSGKCIAIDENGKENEFRYKISDLIKELNPKEFFQINRSEIVNINFIEKIEPYFGDRLAISIKNYKPHLITSASTTSEFRKWIE
ncbi:LytTR family DNA-binding domain-containing protein [Aquimarina sp. ERC-38]|uniref:LytR/AlgR family response regulator transcription factor n=1 Tax=Aquimarina sp. ERC-38 TaxID=2949996 RepID=UPI0022452267|nr:LytTR family DNA-binding domain-containing protein [Aquimarina sp. ERC-38]UZO80693.1 LytTR family DNA-binding domain-containing protein [Aquimarina sp. ERC-38]